MFIDQAVARLFDDGRNAISTRQLICLRGYAGSAAFVIHIDVLDAGDSLELPFKQQLTAGTGHTANADGRIPFVG